jgi:hypothetical protein
MLALLNYICCIFLGSDSPTANADQGAGNEAAATAGNSQDARVSQPKPTTRGNVSRGGTNIYKELDDLPENMVSGCCNTCHFKIDA